MDNLSIYVCVRIKKGVTIHFLTEYDNSFCYDCEIHKWGAVQKLAGINPWGKVIDDIGNREPFINAQDIIDNFNYTDITEHEKLKIDSNENETFKAIKEAYVVAAKQAKSPLKS
jgi:hypothetical protein